MGVIHTQFYTPEQCARHNCDALYRSCYPERKKYFALLDSINAAMKRYWATR